MRMKMIVSVKSPKMYWDKITKFGKPDIKRPFIN